MPAIRARLATPRLVLLHGGQSLRERHDGQSLTGCALEWANGVQRVTGQGRDNGSLRRAGESLYTGSMAANCEGRGSHGEACLAPPSDVGRAWRSAPLDSPHVTMVAHVLFHYPLDVRSPPYHSPTWPGHGVFFFFFVMARSTLGERLTARFRCPHREIHQPWESVPELWPSPCARLLKIFCPAVVRLLPYPWAITVMVSYMGAKEKILLI